MDNDVPGRRRSDLLTRRRRETEWEIAEAALELFERQGVAHTTVEQIAERAGVSPRTFFRYSPSKEGAVMLYQGGIDEEVFAALEPERAGDDPIRALEEGFVRAVAELDNEATAKARRVLRVRQLAAAEPSVAQAMMHADTERNERTVAKLAAALGTSPDSLEPRAIVAVLDATMQIMFEDWVRRAEAGEHPKVSELYARARKLIAAAAQYGDRRALS
ncbi:TetR family transcriptional regulator [Amycolatopsis jejuensis]|uniref:TetR family transcriptional regulator n=1 Tax=Amycolatopsis jejuensis TaxID=330084 RepID=UPI000690182F|nr:TetR family transcriptional regulator [Amycolatopsis jejuensis]